MDMGRVGVGGTDVARGRATRRGNRCGGGWGGVV